MLIQLHSLRHFAKPGGATSYCLRVGKELLRRGHTVTGLCPEDSTSGSRHQSINGFHFETHPPIKPTPLLWRIPSIGRIRKYKRVARTFSRRADLIVTRSARYALAAKNALGSKTVVLVCPGFESFSAEEAAARSNIVTDLLKIANRRVIWRLEKAALAKADIVVFSSNELLEWAAAWFRGRQASWNVCPFGSNDILEDVTRDRDEVRRELGIPNSAPVAITVSVLDRNKNTQLLLRAVEQCQEPRLHLLVVGDGDERPALQALANELGIAERTRFLGLVSNPADYYNAADFFALASQFESFGHVYLEAMAARLPVLGPQHNPPFTFSVLHSIIGESGCGLTFDRDNLADLTDKVYMLSRDPQLRADMGKAGRQRALTQFSWKKHVDQILQLANRSRAASPAES